MILAVLISTALIAQDSQTYPPAIMAKIPIGETVLIEDTTLTFKSIIEDSRCPSDVTCVWAGFNGHKVQWHN